MAFVETPILRVDLLAPGGSKGWYGMRGFIGKLFGFDQEIEVLKGKIRALSWDEPFGMWTRAAFLHFCAVMPRGLRHVFFLDFTGIHDLNHRLGYREVDRRIQRTFSISFRTSDLIARWYSGDEVVILFDGGIEGALRKMGELRVSAHANGLDFRSGRDVWRVGEEPIQDVVERIASTFCRTVSRERWPQPEGTPLPHVVSAAE